MVKTALTYSRWAKIDKEKDVKKASTAIEQKKTSERKSSAKVPKTTDVVLFSLTDIIYSIYSY